MSAIQIVISCAIDICTWWCNVSVSQFDDVAIGFYACHFVIRYSAKWKDSAINNIDQRLLKIFFSEVLNWALLRQDELSKLSYSTITTEDSRRRV